MPIYWPRQEPALLLIKERPLTCASVRWPSSSICFVRRRWIQPFLNLRFKSLGEIVTCKRLDVPPLPVVPQQVVDEARQLFNEHRFWEVHEVLEGLWKELSGSEKQLVQGLILVAASLVHAQKDEEAVMWKMLADALEAFGEAAG